MLKNKLYITRYIMTKTKKWFVVNKPQQKGNFTQIPNALLDDNLLYTLSGMEYKVLLYMYRNRFDHKYSHEQIGKVTGTHKDHVRKILRSLLNKKILLKNDEGGYYINLHFNPSGMKIDKLQKEIENLNPGIFAQDMNTTSGQICPDISGQNCQDLNDGIVKNGQNCPDETDEIARIDNSGLITVASHIEDFSDPIILYYNNTNDMNKMDNDLMDKKNITINNTSLGNEKDLSENMELNLEIESRKKEQEMKQEQNNIIDDNLKNDIKNYKTKYFKIGICRNNFLDIYRNHVLSTGHKYPIDKFEQVVYYTAITYLNVIVGYDVKYEEMSNDFINSKVMLYPAKITNEMIDASIEAISNDPDFKTLHDHLCKYDLKTGSEIIF